MIEINIAKDYTKTPGGRYISEGQFSGEDFRESLLIPKYKEAVNKNDTLQIVLDGGYGYGSSFLEEAFGGLVRKERKVDVKRILIISEEEKQLVNDIYKYMDDALNKLGDGRK